MYFNRRPHMHRVVWLMSIALLWFVIPVAKKEGNGVETAFFLLAQAMQCAQFSITMCAVCRD